MTDLYRQISGSHSRMQDLMARLPGYRGYQENTDRRAADRIIRDNVANAFKAQLADLIAAQKTLLSAPNGLSYMGKLHDVQSQLQVLIDRVSTAMPGYAGFYDAIKVGPAELEKLYDFDGALLAQADKFKAAIETLNTAIHSSEGLDSAIAALGTTVTEANTAFNQRHNVISGLT
jgi:hypothetical protein